MATVEENLDEIQSILDLINENIRHSLTIPNNDSNRKTPNVVDGLFAIAKAIDRLSVELTQKP